MRHDPIAQPTRSSSSQRIEKLEGDVFRQLQEYEDLNRKMESLLLDSARLTSGFHDVDKTLREEKQARIDFVQEERKVREDILNQLLELKTRCNTEFSKVNNLIVDHRDAVLKDAASQAEQFVLIRNELAAQRKKRRTLAESAKLSVADLNARVDKCATKVAVDTTTREFDDSLLTLRRNVAEQTDFVKSWIPHVNQVEAQLHDVRKDIGYIRTSGNKLDDKVQVLESKIAGLSMPRTDSSSSSASQVTLYPSELASLRERVADRATREEVWKAVNALKDETLPLITKEHDRITVLSRDLSQLDTELRQLGPSLQSRVKTLDETVTRLFDTCVDEIVGLRREKHTLSLEVKTLTEDFDALKKSVEEIKNHLHNPPAYSTYSDTEGASQGGGAMLHVFAVSGEEVEAPSFGSPALSHTMKSTSSNSRSQSGNEASSAVDVSTLSPTPRWKDGAPSVGFTPPLASMRGHERVIPDRADGYHSSSPGSPGHAEEKSRPESRPAVRGSLPERLPSREAASSWVPPRERDPVPARQPTLPRDHGRYEGIRKC